MQWTIEKDNYLIELWPNTGIHKLKEMFGTSYYQIRKRGRELGMHAKNQNFHREDLWPEWRVKRLLELWEAAVPYREIAHQLTQSCGVTISRNAVIGKIHRMGLSEQTKKPEFKPFASARIEQCQWPTGESPYVFSCKAKLKPGSPYCEHHHGIAYRGTVDVEI